MRIEHVKAGMVLSADILDEHGHLLLEKGIILTDAYLSRMESLGLRDLPVMDAYSASLKTTYAVSEQLREELALCYRGLFYLKTEEVLSQKLRKVYLRQLNSTVDSVITEIDFHMSRIVNVQVRKPTADEVDHAVNVCLLSVITGLYLSMPRAVLQELALGALLHDIGKSLTPVSKALAAGPEFHCLAGQSLLRQSGGGSVIPRIAAEHHEHHDGSGYPAGLSGNAIHPLSRIVAVTNFFDNKITQSTKEGTPRHDIMEQLLASGNRQFDLTVLRAFCHTAAIYPVGSLVRLSNGETGYVAKNQPPYPLRPVVRVFRGNKPTDINLILKPQIVINELIQE